MSVKEIRLIHGISKTDAAYFNAAKAVSELSDHKHKLGCVVVLGHRIISSSSNSASKCNSIQAKLDSKKYGCDCPGHPHAELSALYPLIKRNADLSKASIYVYRQTRDGKIACAKPCSSCEWLIKQCGIKKVFYTTKDGIVSERW